MNLPPNCDGMACHDSTKDDSPESEGSRLLRVAILALLAGVVIGVPVGFVLV